MGRGEAFLVRPIRAKALTYDAAYLNWGHIPGNAPPLLGHLRERRPASDAKDERR